MPVNAPLFAWCWFCHLYFFVFFCLRPFPILFLCYIISIQFAYVLFNYTLFVLRLLSYFSLLICLFVLYSYNIDDSRAAKKGAIKKGRCFPPIQQTRVKRNQKRSQSRAERCRDTLLREVRSKCAPPLCCTFSGAHRHGRKGEYCST